MKKIVKMKKSIICIIIICTLFIFSSCGGGGGSSNTPVTISVSFQNNHSGSLSIKSLPLTHVRYTVTGPKMNSIEGTVPVIGNAADIYLMVPSGPQRLFKIQILDSSGVVVYAGEKAADLKGDPVKIVIDLEKTDHNIQCNDIAHEGSDKPETFNIELGKRSGTFQVDYETFTIEDRLVITYEGNTLYDSGCISTNGLKTEYISYSGNTTVITVNVQPNCAGEVDTQWNFRVYCPTVQQN